MMSISTLPFLDREVLQFRHAAPVLLRHEGDEYLREVHPGNEEGERDHQHEQDPLVGAELAYVWQQVVEVHVFGLLVVLVVAATLAALDGRKPVGRGRDRQTSVGTRVLRRGQVPGNPGGRRKLLLRRHVAVDRDLRGSPGEDGRQQFLRSAAAAFRIQPSGCCARRAQSSDPLIRAARQHEILKC